MKEIIVDDTEVYDDLPGFDWNKYQRGFMGILNNSYNQSCNSGTKVLGDMSEITSEFEGGSYEDFIEFYNDEYDGEQRKYDAIDKMAENLVSRIESVGGTLDWGYAVSWASRYIESMLVNSYRGFMDEERAIELVADELQMPWRVAPPEDESRGIDGYIGGRSVQVKPDTHTSLDVNSYETDLLVVYEYDGERFKVRYPEV